MTLVLHTERLVLINTTKEGMLSAIKNDASNYYLWFADEKVTRYNSHGLFPQNKKEFDTYMERCENDKSLLCFMIFLKKEERHIGMISLQSINYINRSAEFAVVIGETDCWGKGYTTEAAIKLFDHGFMKLGLNRIWSGTSILNRGMIQVFKKLGMKYEGQFKKAQFLNGQFEDIMEYAILRGEWDEHRKNNK